MATVEMEMEMEMEMDHPLSLGRYSIPDLYQTCAVTRDLWHAHSR
jgi:hypothetical protein